MRYLENESVWLLSAPAGEDYEIAVPGDPGGPIPALLDLANRALPSVTSLRTRAIALFDEFIRSEAFSEQSHWHFEGVDLGHPIRHATGRFRLTFSRDGDTYGEWSVLFQESNGRFFPVQFNRTSI